MAIFKIVPADNGQRTIGRTLWGWVVVGAVVLFLLGGSLTFMTSGHPWIADAFYAGAACLFAAKFLTWEFARQQNRQRRRNTFLLAMSATAVVLIGAIAGNHYLNRTSSQSASSESAPEGGGQPTQDAVKTGDSVTAKVTHAPSIAAKVTRARVDWHNKQNWRQNLHTGMTRTEVRQLFGEPESEAVSLGIEHWWYGWGSIVFDMNDHPDGSLDSWLEP